MDTMENIKIAFVATVGMLTAFWGWMGWLVVFWVAMMALDYITGTAAAAKDGRWSSAIAREGIWHKLGMVVVVVVAAGADGLIGVILAHIPAIQLPFDYGGLVCPVMLVWYIVTELGSITENAVSMGAPVPDWLAKLLQVSRDMIDKAGDGLSNITTDDEEENKDEVQ